MYTNTSCTIYAKTDSGYDTIHISDCYWQEIKVYEVKKYGAELADSVKIIIPKYALGDYLDVTVEGFDWKIPEGSYIIEGSPEITITDDISPLIEAGNIFAVHSVTNNLRGSEEIQHITILAR